MAAVRLPCDTLHHALQRAGGCGAALASYRDAGIARVLLEVPDLSRDDVLRVLDKNARLGASLT